MLASTIERELTPLDDSRYPWSTRCRGGGQSTAQEEDETMMVKPKGWTEDAYGNDVYRCEECGLDFIEGFNDELAMCDECAEEAE
jgi:hypothetical protein